MIERPKVLKMDKIAHLLESPGQKWNRYNAKIIAESQRDFDAAYYEAEIERLEAENRALYDKKTGAIWYWQGDGDDHLESLTCPILIESDRFRAALTEARRETAEDILETLAEFREDASGGMWFRHFYVNVCKGIKAKYGLLGWNMSEELYVILSRYTTADSWLVRLECRDKEKARAAIAEYRSNIPEWEFRLARLEILPEEEKK